jgi:hypothetical protein
MHEQSAASNFVQLLGKYTKITALRFRIYGGGVVEDICSGNGCFARTANGEHSYNFQ